MPEIHWYHNDTIEAALSEAARQHRPILVDFWHPTCLGCAKLALTTYPDPAVVALLNDRFIGIKYDTTRPNRWFKRLNGSFAHHWHPDVVVLDHHLTEVRRFIGYAPAPLFLARLRIGLGLAHLYNRRAEQALAEFDAALAGSATAAAPEALYWAGVAAYRGQGGLRDLTARWTALRAAFPDSPWAAAADCLDVDVPPDGFDPSDLSTILLRVPAAHA